MPNPPTRDRSDPPLATPPHWRAGAGISPGTWDYAHRRSIAEGYENFVSTAAITDYDSRLVAAELPPVRSKDPVWVADLGCGTGRTAVQLAARGYHVIAVDLSRPMLDRLGEKGLVHVHPLRSNLVTLDALAGDCVDHAVCLFATLGMIRGRTHRIAALTHFRRLVRPGGKLVVHVHHRWAALSERGGVGSLVQSMVCRDRELGDAVYVYRNVGEMFMHRYGRRELIRDLQRAGWGNQALHRINVAGDGPATTYQLAGGFIVVAS